MLADDHPFVLLGVRATLETQAGVTIVGQAVSPASLIELLRRTPCDVLVTDLSMPDPGGGVEDELSLIRQIRDEWPRLRVVVMSTSTNPAILRVLASDGAVSLLSKTEPMHELWRAIDGGEHGAAYIGRSIARLLARPNEAGCEQPLALPLSGMQAMIVRMFVEGRSIGEIAAALGCHRRTVIRQKREAMVKLGVTNDPGLFSCVRAIGILKFESDI
ncbi:DNA-binding response regulator [Paraburkholderia rhynchosiae]|uniref:DNA-binding response regulator n=1 Tax=Paraburkholderia rhynchosiae TaxID=487049 RepID=A0ABX4UYV4_9BURK|nr:DNA-binding response regulator [Paraburkholderia rhynchosiae]